MSAARFRKNTQKYETTSLQVMAGIYRVFRNHENEKKKVLPRQRAGPGHPHRHRGSRLIAVPPDAGLADRRVDCDSAVPHRDVRDPQLHHRRQLHHPDSPTNALRLLLKAISIPMKSSLAFEHGVKVFADHRSGPVHLRDLASTT